MKNHADAMIFHTAICEKNFLFWERSQIALMARRRRAKRSGMEDFYAHSVQTSFPHPAMQPLPEPESNPY